MRTAGRPTTPVAVHAGPRGRRLPDDFLALSIQFRTIAQWAGPAGHAVDPVLVRLIRALDPSGRPILRVGGQGADRTWWPIAHVRRPPGVSDALSPRWINAARRLAAALRARYLLQVNLEAGSTRVARVEADHFLTGLGARNIAALEIGNEPELYKSIPWYWTQDGRALPWYADRGDAVYARTAAYGPAQFIAQWRQFARALPNRLALAGPDLVRPAWLADFATLLKRSSRLHYLDVHAYPVLNCVTDAESPAYPSVAHLLTLSASRDLLAGERVFIGRAHADGDRFLVDEAGADSCGGNAGVSDTMASALWMTDMLFAMDQAGVDGVALHSLPGTVNALFDLRRRGGHRRARLFPAYLGALLFAEAAPAGSRLLRVSDADQTDLRAWSTVARDGTVHVVLLNDGASRVVSLSVPAPDRGRTAQLERLHAGGASSTGGLVLGGRPVSWSATGAVGAVGGEQVLRRRGAYRFAMGAGSAALLTLTAPAG